MKHLKKLPLLVLVALAAMSVAATSALATDDEFIAGSNGLPYTGEIAGSQTHGILQGPTGTDIQCDVATIHGSINDPGPPVAEGQVEVVFDQCQTSSGFDCEVTLTPHDLDFHLIPIEGDEEEGTFRIEDHFVAEVSCFFGLIRCEYEAGPGTPQGPVEAHTRDGAVPVVDFVQEHLRVIGHNTSTCGDVGQEAFWTAEFAITSPAGGLHIRHGM